MSHAPWRRWHRRSRRSHAADEAEEDDLDFDAEEYRAEIARRLDAMKAREEDIAFLGASTDGGTI